MLVIAACSPSQHTMALKKYELALAKGDMNNTIIALKQLAKIDKSIYQNKLEKALNAQKQFGDARTEYHNNNYLSAYISIHHSYRTLPLSQSKELLVEIGKKLIPLLKVQAKIEQSFELSPQSIIEQLKKHHDLAVIEWNLVKVNQFIEKANHSSKLLQESVDILKIISHQQDRAELLNWQLAIEAQQLSIIKAKDMLINMAQSASADFLLIQNDRLVEKSANMLSLLRPSLALQNLQTDFLKAQLDYQPYQTLIENLSLADSSHQNNTHSKWYKQWQALENNVLNVDDNVDKYPSHSKVRIKQLTAYKNKYQKSDALPIFPYQNPAQMIENHQTIQQVIKKLSIDKIIINYGLALKPKG